MRRLVMIMALAAAAACGDNNGTGISGDVSGTYTLRSINGANLPYTAFQTGTTKVEVIDDVITLNLNGTFTETGHTRTTNAGTVTTDVGNDSGTYTTAGTSISLRYSDGSTSVGSVNAGTLTVVDQGLSAVFTK